MRAPARSQNRRTRKKKPAHSAQDDDAAKYEADGEQVAKHACPFTQGAQGRRAWRAMPYGDKGDNIGGRASRDTMAR